MRFKLKVVQLTPTFFGAVAGSLLVACSGCTRGNLVSQGAVDHAASAKANIYIESGISNSRESSWKWDSTGITNGDSFTALQALSASEVWVLGDRGALYQTADGGQTWREVSVSAPPQSEVTSFYFIDPSVGWVTVTRTPSDTLHSEGFESWVLGTRDGGATWQVQFSGKGLELDRVLFVNEQEGWVIGSRLIKNETLQNDYFVIHTADRGEHWTDVSNNLNPDVAGGHVTDIHSTGPSAALILTSGRKIFATATGGQEWQLVSSITDIPAQTVMLRLGIRENYLPWILGGSDGREGTWMMLALEGKENSWVVHRADNIFLSDAAFLSDTELIACGSVATDDKARLEGGGREGVVLYSSDRGRHWSIVYRNPRVKSINALAAVSPNQVWVVGGDGLILRLESPSKNTSHP